MSSLEKNDKLARDRMDCENDRVYIWKIPTFPNRSRKHPPKKRVRSSDLENDSMNDTMVATASDSSPDSAGWPISANH